MSPDPVLDIERLQEIQDLSLAGAELDPEIQKLLEKLAAEMELPIALVSIVLDGAQYFLGMHGVEGWMRETRGTPVEWSFCTQVVRNRGRFVVEDASSHPITKSNPLVGSEGIRCYAGAPLRTSRGHVLGSLCVIGNKDRAFEPEELEALDRLAAEVTRRLEARRATD